MHLSSQGRKSHAPLKLLLRHDDLFDGALGTWNGPPAALKLKKDAMPHFARPFSAPHIHERTLKIETDRLGNVLRENLTSFFLAMKK
jgi:hypothetical protein